MINDLLALHNGELYVSVVFLLLLTFVIAGLKGILCFFDVNSGFGAKELVISIATLMTSSALMFLFVRALMP